MAYFEFIDRLKKLDLLLRNEVTGTSAELANKLGVSRRTIFDYIDILKSKGAEIKFSRSKKTFYYQSKYTLNF